MPTNILNVNGLKVANIKSKGDLVTFGIAVLAGACYETPEIAGIAHFAEHMAFRGTKTRHWKKISEEFAKNGIFQNAYTSNDEIFYYAHFHKQSIEPAIDLLTDMFFNSTFPEDEVNRERQIIQREKDMYDDDPNSYFMNSAYNYLFEWNRGHSTLGEDETIAKIIQEDMQNYLTKHTGLDNMLFIVSGNINDNDLISMISKRLPNNIPPKASVKNIPEKMWADEIKDGMLIIEKTGIRQSKICLFTQGLSRHDDLNIETGLVLNALGGGMYSRLFTKIREELGLCYEISANTSTISYPNDVVTNIWIGTTPDKVDIAVEECNKIIDDVMKNGITEEEFTQAKNCCLTSSVSSLETSKGKVSHFLRRYLSGKDGDVESSIKRLKKCTLKSCNKAAQKMFTAPKYWAVLNPVSEEN
jgi:predicted Zn-dependent peptidase